jgi:hypothetical protein
MQIFLIVMFHRGFLLCLPRSFSRGKSQFGVMSNPNRLGKATVCLISLSSPEGLIIIDVKFGGN